LLSEVIRRRVRVLAGDDQPLFRDALTRVVRQRSRFELVGEVADGPHALEALERLAPDVAVLSLTLPGVDGERVLNAVVRDGLCTRVLLLTDREPADTAYRLIERGAAGCLTRTVGAEQLCEAITTAARGGVFLGNDLHTGLANEIRLRGRDDRPVLTSREHDVLRLMAEGLGNIGIARRLQVSVPTVKTHAGHLYEKLGTSQRTAAVAEAMRRGLIE
jgi:two-component system, NarL family, nitrate/nitrite response regulator NarL